MLPKIERLYEQIEKRHETVLSTLNAATIEQRNFRSGQGEWSMLETGEHLMLMEKAVFGPVKMHIESGLRGRKTGLLSNVRSSVVGIAMRLNLPMQTPLDSIKPTGTVSFDHLLLQWEEIWQNWIELLQGITPHMLGYPVCLHPVIGEMDIVQTLNFLRMHADHHLRQMQSVAKAKDYPTSYESSVVT